MRGRIAFALFWNAVTWFTLWTVIEKPKPHDQWLLPLVGLLVLVGLALLLDVIVRLAKR